MRRLGDVVVAMRDGGLDDVALDVVERPCEIDNQAVDFDIITGDRAGLGTWSHQSRARNRQHAGFDYLPLVQDHGVADDVLQFPNIARPAIDQK